MARSVASPTNRIVYCCVAIQNRWRASLSDPLLFSFLISRNCLDGRVSSRTRGWIRLRFVFHKYCKWKLLGWECLSGWIGCGRVGSGRSRSLLQPVSLLLSVEAAWLDGSWRALVAGLVFDLSSTSVVSESCSAGSVSVSGLVVEELVVVACAASCSSCLCLLICCQ